MRGGLLSQTKLLNDRAVTLDIFLHKIVEKAAAVTDHFQQTSAAVVVIVVHLQVFVEIVDAVGEDGDLYFRRTRVALVGLVLVDDLVLDFLFHGFTSDKMYRPQD